MKFISLLLLIFLFLIESTFGWRFFGRGSGYNSFGGYTASQYYNGQFPYYNQPFYPRYQQPYMNGPYSNQYAFRNYQRNGVGFYEPESYRYVASGAREAGQGYSPYDFYGK